MVYLAPTIFVKKKMNLPLMFQLRGVIRDKDARDTWYSAQMLTEKKKTPKGTYAFGSAGHRVTEIEGGWLLGGEKLPKNTPVYEYGFRIGERMSTPHGAWYFKHQIPSVDLKTHASIEEKIFHSKDKTLGRSGKSKLRVRCGKGFYRIVKTSVACHPVCYIFGTNLKLDTRKYPVPTWMRRPSVVLPHPARTSRDEIGNKALRIQIGRPKAPGMVRVGGIEMLCTAVGALCRVVFQGKTFIAHASVVLSV